MIERDSALRLTELVRTQLTEAQSDDQAEIQLFGQMCTELDNPTWTGEINRNSTSHPAIERWLGEAAALNPESELTQAFAQCAPHLNWQSAYTDEPATPAMKHFWANYSFAPLVTAAGMSYTPGPLQVPAAALFLVCHGAEIVYPEHYHPAREAYGIVSGTADWSRGSRNFVARPPQSTFAHLSGMPHATTTTDEPVLCWAAWTGDLSKPAMLT